MLDRTREQGVEIGEDLGSADECTDGCPLLIGRPGRDVDDNQPANTVIDQSPDANTSAAKGSVVTLTVSKGPKTSTIPDVTSLDLGTAEQTLQDSGFRAKVVYQDVNDPNNEGLVLSESPPGGTQAKPNTTVTLTVGRYRGGQTTTTTPTTPTTTSTSPQPPPVP